RASNLLNSQLATTNTKPTSTFDLIFKSSTLNVSDPAFQSAVGDALAPIQNDSRILNMTTPYNTNNPRVAQALTSKDGHEALVLVQVDATGQKAWKAYSDLRSKVSSSSLQVTGTGFVPVNQAFNTTLEAD